MTGRVALGGTGPWAPVPIVVAKESDDLVEAPLVGPLLGLLAGLLADRLDLLSTLYDENASRTLINCPNRGLIREPAILVRLNRDRILLRARWFRI